MKKAINIGMVAVCCFFLVYMIGTLVYTSSYSVFYEDDFAVVEVMEGMEKNLLSCVKAAVVHVIDFYTGWQGTYFGAFLSIAINPVGQNGLGQLRWVMAINSLLFFLSLLFFAMRVFKVAKIELNAISIAVITAMVFSFCGYETYPEIFFWFGASVYYSFPVSFVLLALGIYIMLNDKSSNVQIVLSSVLGFLAMGGSLVVAGFGCYIALLIIIYDLLADKRIEKRKMIVFFALLAGALVNALAPGNYSRHAVGGDDGLHVFDAIKASFILVMNRWQTLLNYNYLLIILILFACGLFIKKQSRLSFAAIAVSVLGVFTPVVAAFPYALGTGNMFPANRCAFIIDLGIVMSSFLLVLCIGNVGASFLNGKMRIFFAVIIISFMIIFCKFDGYGVSDFKTWQLTRLNSEGVFEDHYYAHVRFYDWLRTQKGKDVVIPAEHCPYGIDDVQNLMIYPDPNHWVNKLIALYCGVKSVAPGW